MDVSEVSSLVFKMSVRGDRIFRRVIRGTDAWMRLSPRTRVEISPHIADLLSRPSWSICSLLPDRQSVQERKEYSITSEKLRHLLKLSALPAPKSEQQEKEMLETLESQIHFVKEIQKVDTTNVEPLVAIRDETSEALQEQEVTLEKLQPWLDLEEKVGKNGTVRRRPVQFDSKPKLTWDPFAMGPSRETRQMGRYFYVRRQKKVSPSNQLPTSAARGTNKEVQDLSESSAG